MLNLRSHTLLICVLLLLLLWQYDAQDGRRKKTKKTTTTTSTVHSRIRADSIQPTAASLTPPATTNVSNISREGQYTHTDQYPPSDIEKNNMMTVSVNQSTANGLSIVRTTSELNTNRHEGLLDLFRNTNFRFLVPTLPTPEESDCKVVMEVSYTTLRYGRCTRLGGMNGPYICQSGPNFNFQPKCEEIINSRPTQSQEPPETVWFQDVCHLVSNTHHKYIQNLLLLEDWQLITIYIFLSNASHLSAVMPYFITMVLWNKPVWERLNVCYI